jgi:hypothetical protein
MALTYVALWALVLGIAANVVGATDTGRSVGGMRDAVVKEAQRMKNRQLRGPPGLVQRANGLRVASASVEPTYVALFAFAATNCTGDPFVSATYGTNLCLPISDTTTSALSMMYYWNATAGNLYELFYTDSACQTPQISTGIVFSFAGQTIGACDVGTIYNITSTYSRPSYPGLVSE